jgi:hypothetical protein
MVSLLRLRVLSPPVQDLRPLGPLGGPKWVKYGGKTPKTRILRCLAVGHLNGNQWGSCSCRYPPTGDYTPFGWILTPYGARPWKVRSGPWDLVQAGLSTPRITSSRKVV